MQDENDTESPLVDPDAWIAPSVQMFGKIRIGAGSSVWYNAVLRAESHHITIGRMTNLQDFVMAHIGYATPTIIGDFCSITHHTTIHGCTIGDNCLIGINAVVMDGAVIGEGSIVAGGALVTEGKEFPPHSIIGGVPAKLLTTRDSTQANRMNAWYYNRNAEAYRKGDHRAWSGDVHALWLEKKMKEIQEGTDD
jgi:carbonic anhydrase/acetyltransferase-like protein (isoleucine patch superfamily)